jgi:hypothetical protein
MSAFKEGKIIDVNQTTNELTIQLDQPLPTVFNQPSKFYAPSDDLLEEDLTTVNSLSFLFFVDDIENYSF